MTITHALSLYLSIPLSLSLTTYTLSFSYNTYILIHNLSVIQFLCLSCTYKILLSLSLSLSLSYPLFRIYFITYTLRILPATPVRTQFFRPKKPLQDHLTVNKKLARL